MSEFIGHDYQTSIFIGKLEPSYTFQFSNKDGVVVGTLDFNQNPITFTGDTESSARVFFDYLIQVWPEMIKKHMEQHSGMVSVPVEPTPAMIEAIKRDFALTTKGAKRIYEIIITAAQEQQ